jgi:hypothetical protein
MISLGGLDRNEVVRVRDGAIRDLSIIMKSLRPVLISV